jgi:hypothetical protein
MFTRVDSINDRGSSDLELGQRSFEGQTSHPLDHRRQQTVQLDATYRLGITRAGESDVCCHGADRLDVDFPQAATRLVDTTHQSFINAVHRPFKFRMSADKEPTPLHKSPPLCSEIRVSTLYKPCVHR